MKRTLALFLLFGALIALTPMLAALPAAGDAPAAGGETAPQAPDEPAAAEAGAGSIAVFDEGAGAVLALSMRQYLVGALLAEMPLSYEGEALKAQVVAAHSYARYAEAFRKTHPLEALCGAAFTVDTVKKEGFLTEAAAKDRFGSGWYLAQAEAEGIVDSVLGQLLTWEGQPAACCWHALSAGRTEAADNVFQQPLPYLCGAESDWDEAAEGYESAVTVSYAALSEKLRAADPDFSPWPDPSGWLGAVQRSEAGTVLRMELCGRAYSGPQLRELFRLRSPNFSASPTEDGLLFTVHGYGHGVGMSQFGANEMAKAGADFAAILAHYYPGTLLADAAPFDTGGGILPGGSAYAAAPEADTPV